MNVERPLKTLLGQVQFAPAKSNATQIVPRGGTATLIADALTNVQAAPVERFRLHQIAKVEGNGPL